MTYTTILILVLNTFDVIRVTLCVNKALKKIVDLITRTIVNCLILEL